MNFDDLVNEYLDKYVVSEVSRNPFMHKKEDDDCDEEVEKPTAANEDEEEVDPSELSDEDTVEDS